MRPWTIVALLWLAYWINYVDRQAVFSILPVLREELGFTNAQLGLIGSIFIWVYSLCCPPAGRLADRARREVIIPLSMVLWSLATLATGLSRSVAEFLFWRGMMGVTEGLYFPAAVSAIGSVHPGATRSRAIAIHGSAQFAGIAAGGWLGGWMAESWGWRWGFAALAVLGVLYAPLLRLGLGRLPAANVRQDSGSRPRDVLAARCYGALALAFFMFCTMLWMLYAWLPNFIYERYGLSLAASGFTATLFLQAGSAAGILLGGALADGVARSVPAGRFYVASLGLLLCSPLAYATVAVNSLALLKVASAGFGFFAGFMMSSIIASAYDVIAAANYGFGAGALTMIGGLAGGLAIYSVGRWKESLGVETLLAWGSAAGVFSALLLALVVATQFDRDRRLAQTAAAAG
jgi:MFS family permease